MARTVALVMLATMVAGVVACAEAPVTRRTVNSRTSGIERPIAMATPSPRPGDPAVTRRVCAAAVQAATNGLRIFDEQMAVLERAAARDDEAAVINAATVITKSLRNLAVSFHALSRRSSRVRVQAALRQAATELAIMSSESYVGTSADQRRELAELAGTLEKVCA